MVDCKKYNLNYLKILFILTKDGGTFELNMEYFDIRVWSDDTYVQCKTIRKIIGISKQITR